MESPEFVSASRSVGLHLDADFHFWKLLEYSVGSFQKRARQHCSGSFRQHIFHWLKQRIRISERLKGFFHNSVQRLQRRHLNSSSSAIVARSSFCQHIWWINITGLISSSSRLCLIYTKLSKNSCSRWSLPDATKNHGCHGNERSGHIENAFLSTTESPSSGNQAMGIPKEFMSCRPLQWNPARVDKASEHII